MAYTDDPMGPRRRALVDGLAGNTGISGAMPGGVGLPQIGGAPAAGNFNGKGIASAMYDTSGMSDAQRSAFQRDTQAARAKSAADFAADGAYLSAHGGQFGDHAQQFQGGADPSAGAYGGKLVGGTQFAQQGAAPAAAPAATPFTFGRDSVSSILGAYDHTPAGLQKAFAEHPELAASGAKITGSKGDKIIDPTTGRAVDVIQAAGEGGKAWQWLDGDGGGGAPQGQRGGGMNPLFAGSSVAPMLQGDPSANIQNAMQQMGALGNTSRIQQLIAALSGGGQ